jgi:hypothetical protein
MELLRGIIDGTIDIPEVEEEPTEGMSTLDFWPIDDTNRAFSMGMEL